MYTNKYIIFFITTFILLLIPSSAFCREYDVTFAQIKYNGQWDPYPGFEKTIITSLRQYTSVDINPEKIVLSFSDNRLFHYPFIYLAGCKTFPSLKTQELAHLKNYLIGGGLLFVDNCAGTPGLSFDKMFKREMKKIFPDFSLRRLPSSHAVYRSFFLLRSIGGRRLASPYIEGLSIGDWTPIIYSQNDFGGAWVKNPLGGFKYTCEPGGERQRKMAIRSGINIILYALTVNYKKDQVHIPFILKRRR